MDSKIDIWNVLHDGEITAISDENSDSLTMFVNIPWLRRRIEPIGDSFVLLFEGLKILEYEDTDGAKTSLRDELDVCSIEILSTPSKLMPVTVMMTMGQLTLDYENINFKLDTGQEIDFETIDRLCEEYWAEWKDRAEQSAGK